LSSIGLDPSLQRFSIALQGITDEVAVRESTTSHILVVLRRKVVTGLYTKEVGFAEYWIGYESTWHSFVVRLLALGWRS
jgi:hypothetical protein